MNHAPEVIKKFLAEHNISESLWYDLQKTLNVHEQMVEIPKRIESTLKEIHACKVKSRNISAKLKQMRKSKSSHRKDDSWLYNELLRMQRNNSTDIKNLRGIVARNKQKLEKMNGAKSISNASHIACGFY